MRAFRYSYCKKLVEGKNLLEAIHRVRQRKVSVPHAMTCGCGSPDFLVFVRDDVTVKLLLGSRSGEGNPARWFAQLCAFYAFAQRHNDGLDLYEIFPMTSPEISNIYLYLYLSSYCRA